MKFKISIVVFAVLLLVFLFCQISSAQFLDTIKDKFSKPKNLKYMKLKSKKITVSGSSAGGAFAMQLYLSHSKLFAGVAIFPGVLYRCVEANEDQFSGILGCVNGVTNLTKVFDIVECLEDDKLIDKLKYLKKKRHYIEHGYNDEKFSFNNGRQIAKFFSEYSHHVRYHENNGIHGIDFSKTIQKLSNYFKATDSCGFSCSSKIYLNSGCINCGYSAVHQGLSYIRKKKLARIKSKSASCYQGKQVAGLSKFNQEEFVPTNLFGIPSIPMEKYGYMYVPPRCEANITLCHLHVAFHGCSVSQLFGGIPWHITCSGYLEVAAANNIIMLFPQAAIQYSDPYSFIGCWDFVGYTGPMYGTKRGSQVDAVYKMIKRITKKPNKDINYVNDDYNVNNNYENPEPESMESFEMGEPPQHMEMQLN